MELPFETILAVFGALSGGGGIGAFISFRYLKRRYAAETVSVEATATQNIQQVYDRMIEDFKDDREEQRKYIAELKEDRMHLRKERDELRARLDEFEGTIRDLRRDVSRNGRIVECMKPLLCGRAICGNRLEVTFSDNGQVDITNGERKGGEE